jgi:hypothetical protein
MGDSTWRNLALLVLLGSLAWAVLIVALCARDRWRGR